MSIYTFGGKNLEDLAHSVVLNNRFKLPFQEEWTDKKGVWLVKDAGIYLVNAHAFKAERRQIVVMCDELEALLSGSGSDDNDDEVKEMLYGDDYAYFLDLDKDAWELVAKGFVNLRVEMNADNFTVSLPPTAKGLAATTVAHN